MNEYDKGLVEDWEHQYKDLPSKLRTAAPSPESPLGKMFAEAADALEQLQQITRQLLKSTTR